MPGINTVRNTTSEVQKTKIVKNTGGDSQHYRQIGIQTMRDNNRDS